MSNLDMARALLRRFRGDQYLFGAGVLPGVGAVVASLGDRLVLVRGMFPGSDDFVQTIRNSLARAGVALVGEIRGAGPNTPRQDLLRVANELKALDPDAVVSNQPTLWIGQGTDILPQMPVRAGWYDRHRPRSSPGGALFMI